ncbi:hypothetical protein LEMLEM_LOCUS14457 [Lemmus lemmus]
MPAVAFSIGTFRLPDLRPVRPREATAVSGLSVGPPVFAPRFCPGPRSTAAARTPLLEEEGGAPGGTVLLGLVTEWYESVWERPKKLREETPGEVERNSTK